jgi:hypothetical protein
MHPGIRTILILTVNFSWAFAVAAQSGSVTASAGTTNRGGRGPGVTCGMTVRPMPSAMAAVRGAPYSVVRESSQIRTLADGTHITYLATSEKRFRDSQGRTRTEAPLCGHMTDDPDAVLIQIHDPVSGFAYILDVQNHLAYRYALRVLGASSASGGAATLTPALPQVRTEQLHSTNAPKETTEPLPPQTVDGVTVDGTRTTTVIPEGAEGNDRPIIVVSETWFSPYLNLPLLAKTSDPRSGETTSHISNVDTSEPSPLLFQPPLDYKVVDATEPVGIIYSTNSQLRAQ